MSVTSLFIPIMLLLGGKDKSSPHRNSNISMITDCNTLILVSNEKGENVLSVTVINIIIT